VTSETPGKAIVLHENDNVATALEDLVKGSTFVVTSRNLSILLQDDINFGHKFALQNLPVGEAIVKYGVPIGALTQPVSAGSHVHTHNLVTLQRKGVTTP
jgi:hypothetical protein